MDHVLFGKLYAEYASRLPDVELCFQPACQKADWKRHKKEPCAPIETIVEDDDFWSPLGTRKGTELVDIKWG